MIKNKILLSAIAALFISFTSFGQIKTPAASPSATITQTIGLVDVSVKYSRPGMKGRTIFAVDGLVPLNEIWRTGANSATKFTVSGDVMVGGNKLEKGSYAILSKPSKSGWEFYFYPYGKSSWSSYKEMTPSVTVNATASKQSQSMETMAFAFNDVKDASANLVLQWDKTSVTIPITVETDKTVMKNISSVMAGPSKGDYYNAANYYFSNGKDLKKAYEYIKNATKGEDKKFWQVRKQSQIEAGLGKYKEAIKTATLAMSLAEKAKNMQYVKFNKEAIAKWSKM